MMKKILTYIFSVAAICWSCSPEQMDSNDTTGDNPDVPSVVEIPDTTDGVYVSNPEVEWGDSLSASRSTLVLEGSTMKFAWATGDCIGTYPVLTTPVANQMPLTLITDAGTTTGEFGSNGSRYNLRGAENNKYVAYFPYSAQNEATLYTAIPVDYTGQTQTATAKMSYYVAGNTTEYNKSEAEASAHLGTYDYMCDCAEQTSTLKTSFDMQRLSSIVRFYIQVPDNIIFDGLDVMNPTKVFVTKGTVDISADSPVITSTATSNTISLSFGSAGLDFTTDDVTKSLYYHSGKGCQMLVAYMMVAPVNLTSTTNTLYLKGHTSAGVKKYYKATLSAKKQLVAGKIYQWTTAKTDEDASISLSAITVEQWQEETINMNISTD